MQPPRCGFVVLAGPTNSGKSTLLNALVGKKVSIVSPKPQTTYHVIRGIRNFENAQVIFTDVPGFQGRKEHIPRLLNRVAEHGLREANVVLWVFDVAKESFPLVFQKLKRRIEQASDLEHRILVLNKVDKIAKMQLLPLLSELAPLFAEVIPISALKKDGTDRVLQAVAQRMPEGAHLFPDERVTDRPQEFLLSEFIREKIYALAEEEVPYSVRVQIDGIEEGKKGPVIYASLRVNSDSRKGILVGQRGEFIKNVGIRARKEIERHLGKPVCLKLQVALEKGWTENSRSLERYLELA